MKKEPIVQNVKPGQNIVQSAISTNRNLKDLVAELINIELNLDKRAKKAWKVGDTCDLKKAGYFCEYLIQELDFKFKKLETCSPQYHCQRFGLNLQMFLKRLLNLMLNLLILS
jgi:hypothetical protein